MRIAWPAVAVLVVASALVAAAFIVARGTDDSADAKSELMRLSAAGDRLSYRARYSSEAPDNQQELASLTVYREQDVGFRVDLPSPIELDDRDREQQDILKGGDI